MPGTTVTQLPNFRAPDHLIRYYKPIDTGSSKNLCNNTLAIGNLKSRLIRIQTGGGEKRVPEKHEHDIIDPVHRYMYRQPLSARPVL